MKLDSARNLKSALLSRHVAPLMTAGNARGAIAFSAGPMSRASMTRRTIALGIVQKGRKDFRLAIRVQRRELMDSAQLDAMIRQAKGEVDLRYVGRAVKRAGWTFNRQRPLLIGSSIGHFAITAGTLGCFVKRRSNGETLILSNNHVLANENDARRGDAILQPGEIDGGRLRTDVVGKLAAFVRLKRSANVLDCAVASINASIEHKVDTLKGLGRLMGQGPGFLDEGVRVAKVGRTTGVTRGKVTAFEIDNLTLDYGEKLGSIVFDDSIEVESTQRKPFSLGGDSGSLIVDADRKGVGLLYGGSDIGGSNGLGLTWANPIQRVLDALKVDLAW